MHHQYLKLALIAPISQALQFTSSLVTGKVRRLNQKGCGSVNQIDHRMLHGRQIISSSNKGFLMNTFVNMIFPYFDIIFSHLKLIYITFLINKNKVSLFDTVLNDILIIINPCFTFIFISFKWPMEIIAYNSWWIIYFHTDNLVKLNKIGIVITLFRWAPNGIPLAVK